MKSTNELENAVRDMILLLAFDKGLASKALETIQLEEQTGRLSNEEAIYMFRYCESLYRHLSQYNNQFPDIDRKQEPNEIIQTYRLKAEPEPEPEKAPVKKSLLQKLLNR